MSDEQDRDYHRIYKAVKRPTSPPPVEDDCHCSPEKAKAQKQLEEYRKSREKVEQQDTDQGVPKIQKTGPSEDERRDLAKLLGVTYVPGKQPSDYEILKHRSGSRQQDAPSMSRPQQQPTPKEPQAAYQIEAYMSTGQEFKPIYMEPKPDQDFGKAATMWERDHSQLININLDYVPVVDEDYKVIGHYGHANGPELQMLATEYAKVSKVGGDDPDGVDDSMERMIARGHVYVILPRCRYQNDQKTKVCEKEGYISFRNSYETYVVVTDKDGEVMYAEHISNNGNGEAVDPGLTPFDLIGGAWSVLKLAFKTVVKNGTKTLAKRAATKEAGKLTGKTVGKVGGKVAVKEIKFLKGWRKKMGIPKAHFDDLAGAAKETEVVAMFRANKEVAIPLIENGCPGKPMFFKFKTSSETGVLTAVDPDDFAKVKQYGYFLVGEDKVARRTIMKEGKEVVEELKLDNAFWKVEKNQVIDPRLKKPVVGDYDLLGVAPVKSTGSNVTGVPTDLENGDWTGPWVEKYAAAANKRLGDPPRVLHGAMDAWKGTTDDVAYAIFPDGRVVMMHNKADQDALYKMLGRQGRDGSYPRPSPGTVVKDELAERRAKKKAGK